MAENGALYDLLRGLFLALRYGWLADWPSGCWRENHLHRSVPETNRIVLDRFSSLATEILELQTDNMAALLLRLLLGNTRRARSSYFIFVLVDTKNLEKQKIRERNH